MAKLNAAGKILKTVVDGSAYVGLHAADGGLNVIVDNNTHFGISHPCGAMRVNSGTGNTYYDVRGAAYQNKVFGVGIA